MKTNLSDTVELIKRLGDVSSAFMFGDSNTRNAGEVALNCLIMELENRERNLRLGIDE